MSFLQILRSKSGRLERWLSGLEPWLFFWRKLILGVDSQPSHDGSQASSLQFQRIHSTLLACVGTRHACEAHPHVQAKHYIHKIKFKIRKKTDYEFTNFTWKKCLYLLFHKNILTHFLVNNFMQNMGISVSKFCDEIRENTV